MTITEYEQKIRILNNTEFEELIHELIVKEYDRGNNNFHINHTGKKSGSRFPKRIPQIFGFLYQMTIKL